MNIGQMTLASRLKDARTTASFTQEQVARALELPRTAIVQFESGKPDREIVSHVVHLALEAFRREEISKGKLRDLSTLLDFSAKDLLMLAEAA